MKHELTKTIEAVTGGGNLLVVIEEEKQAWVWDHLTKETKGVFKIDESISTFSVGEKYISTGSEEGKIYIRKNTTKWELLCYLRDDSTDGQVLLVQKN